MKYGSRIKNDVYRENWDSSHPRNHFSVKDFESFCHKHIDSKLSPKDWKEGFPIGEIGKQHVRFSLICVVSNLRINSIIIIIFCSNGLQKYNPIMPLRLDLCVSKVGYATAAKSANWHRKA